MGVNVFRFRHFDARRQSTVFKVKSSSTPTQSLPTTSENSSSSPLLGCKNASRPESRLHVYDASFVFPSPGLRPSTHWSVFHARRLPQQLPSSSRLLRCHQIGLGALTDASAHSLNTISSELPKLVHCIVFNCKHNGLEVAPKMASI
jgi:hypothetical protein